MRDHLGMLKIPTTLLDQIWHPTFHNLIVNNEGSVARMQTATGLKIARHSSGRNPDLIFNLTVNLVSPGSSKPRESSAPPKRLFQG